MLTFKKSETLIRILGLIVSSILFISVFISLFYSPKALGGCGFLDWASIYLNKYGYASNIIMIIATFIIFILFSYAFFKITKKEILNNPKNKSILSLIILAGLGFSVCSPIIYIVDVVAGFIISARYAPVWILAVSIIEFFISIFTPNSMAMDVYNIFKEQGPISLQLTLLFLPSIGSHFFTFFIGALLSNEMRQINELRRKNAELKAMQSMQYDGIRLAERVFIARELHDTIGHHLTAISTNLQLATKLANTEAIESINDAHMVSKLLLADVRDIVSSLREENSINLVEALETLISAIKSPKIQYKISNELANTEPIIAHTIFRCTQELITNSIRHSKADHLYIEIEKMAANYAIKIKDDGRGVTNIVYGNGLKGLQERVLELNGKINIFSELNKGFAVEILIPTIERNV